MTPARPTSALHLCAGNLYGGVERIVVECAASRALCAGLAPAFAVCFDGRLAAEIEASGIRCTSLGDARASRPHTMLRARRRLAGLLTAERPDAVICHSSWIFGLAAPIVRAHDVALILWIHDRVSGRSWPERWARLTAPDVVISNSTFTAESVPLMYPSVPGAVLYAPVAPGGALSSDERASLRRSLGAGDRTVVILLASRFEEWKGHRELLAAAASLPDWCHLWIAGRPQREHEETYERSLRDLARGQGIADRVHFLGERSDVPRLMRAADLHCQPNVAPEPFGLAFVEALYAGVPVVTTAMGGAREIVTPACGVLVTPGDGTMLADVLRRLADDPIERMRLGAAGPARARALCDPASQLNALAGIVAGAAAHRVPA